MMVGGVFLALGSFWLVQIMQDPEALGATAKSSEPDYIVEKSGHSKAATVDVGLLDCRTQACVKLDMGTSFDFFGARANTFYPQITEQQRDNRDLLLKAMAEQGFENYPMEWWHFTWKAGVLPDQAYSFPIQ